MVACAWAFASLISLMQPPANGGEPAPAPAAPAPAPAAAERVLPVDMTPLIPDPSRFPIVDRLKAEAEALRPVFAGSPQILAFLDATKALPDPGPRGLWLAQDRSKALIPREYEALPASEKSFYRFRVFQPEFYYMTGYGSPLIYARALQIAADHGVDLPTAKIFDFGYGHIGHLRLLASLGARVHGVEVEPVFRALYSAPNDTGNIPLADPSTGEAKFGTLILHHGRWPAEKFLVDGVGGDFDLIISKNVLKRGYVRPEREADPRMLVDLGVEDDVFIQALHDALKPGGLALIYNIAPPQNAEGQPYIPHADARCPWDRERLEKAGFRVWAFDEDDSAPIRRVWSALGLFSDEEAKNPERYIFAKYTLLERKDN
jgi:SAM-dependent methyltransferase